MRNVFRLEGEVKCIVGGAEGEMLCGRTIGVWLDNSDTHGDVWK